MKQTDTPPVRRPTLLYKPLSPAGPDDGTNTIYASYGRPLTHLVAAVFQSVSITSFRLSSESLALVSGFAAACAAKKRGVLRCDVREWRESAVYIFEY